MGGRLHRLILMSLDAPYSSTASTEPWHCPRCRLAADPETGQCANCGEMFIPPTPLGRKGIAAQVREGLHAKPVSPHKPGSVGPPPMAAIFRYTVMGVAACLGAALVCYGLAWLGTSMTLTLMRICTGALVCSVGLVLLAVVVTVCWRIIYGVEWALVRAAERRDAKLIMQAELERLTLKEKVRENAKHKPEPTAVPVYEYHKPAKPRVRPGPVTLVFSVLGIIFSTLAVFLSIIPLVGFLSPIPMFTAGCCTIIALVLCHYERSERLLPFIAAGLLMMAVLALIGQFFLWGAAADGISRGLEQMNEEQKIQQQKMNQQLKDSLDSLTRMLPGPGPQQ